MTMVNYYVALEGKTIFVHNIGNSAPENLIDFVTILQEKLITAKVLPSDYEFETSKDLCQCR